MSILTQALYNRLRTDPLLVAMISTYRGGPAVFTTDPAPGDAAMPLIVTAVEVTQTPWDTKSTRGRQIYRDVRCYTDADGSAMLVESIVERVRTLLHRYELTIAGYRVIVAEVNGPTVADEQNAYGRIVSVRFLVEVK
jgi:hypothetical protein